MSARTPAPCDTGPHTTPAQIGHHTAMARSAAQSDFAVDPRAGRGAAGPASPDDRDHGDDVTATDAGSALPRATLRSSQASALATRIVMTVALLMLGALFLICLIGPHIPAGE